MMHLVVTDEAREDLRDIERYTRRTWGVQQSQDYRGLILKTFALLMDKPQRGRKQDRLKAGIRRINTRQHAIFYFVRGDDLVIARVVHQRMEMTAALFVSPED